MEDFRQENNRIQAGFALNAGKLLTQYSAYSESLGPKERYDATLTVCMLQALLTNCWQLIEAMKQNQKPLWLETVTDVPGLFGIRRSYVKENTFSLDHTLTYSEFVEHLRNALSHPTHPEKSPNLPSTGYTTLPDKTGIICRFRLIDSPWIDRGKMQSGYTGNEDKVNKAAERFRKKQNYPCGTLDVRKNTSGGYEIFRENKPYIPIFEAEIPLDALKTLAMELANYLAQPTREDWDGKSITRLVA